MQHLDLRMGGRLSQGGTFNNNVITMTAGLVGARDVYTPEACARLNAQGDALRAELNALGRSLGVAFRPPASAVCSPRTGTTGPSPIPPRSSRPPRRGAGCSTSN